MSGELDRVARPALPSGDELPISTLGSRLPR